MSTGVQNAQFPSSSSQKASLIFAGDLTAWEFEMGWIERPAGQ